MTERNGRDRGLPPSDDTGDWQPEVFRQAGHRTVDWVADYLARIESLPVLPRVQPGDIRRSLPVSPPEEGEPFEDLLLDLDRVVLRGVTHWNHPGFLAYFGITASGPGILGEMVAAAFNTNAMLWKTSPSTTELEQGVLDWLRGMIGLPQPRFGLLTDTASTSTLVALAAARESVPGLEARERGLCAPGTPRLRLYTSEEAHSSVEKAAIVLGLGRAGVRKIPTDDSFRMDAVALAAAVQEDRAAGWRPFAVSATVGTTSTTSVDPIPAVAEICGREHLWLHVDAAYAGSAAVLPEKRWCLAGCEHADSLVTNPHKWLFVPIDASALFLRRPEVLRRALQLVPDYLQTTAAPEATNLMDYGFQLGRRFRAIKLWWVIRTFGVEGIRRRIAEHCRLAEVFAAWVEADPGFELAAPVPFSTVCFRAAWPGIAAEERDARNERVLERVNADGRVFLSHTKLRGAYTLRVAIGNLRTEERHLRVAWELLRAAREGEG
jgi:aromatic-L-amino-acid/L-tryptophan decarboxylase